MTKPPKETSETDTIRIAFSGELINKRVAMLDQEVALRYSEGINQNLVLDLTGVSKIDSRGITFCIRLFNELKKKNLKLTIETGKKIYSFFNQVNLVKMLDIRLVGEASN
jgi:ABC-type transporter Mla MlaB component